MQLASELCAPNEMVSLCLEYISPGISDNDAGEDNNDREAVSASRLLDDNKPSTVAEADRLEKQEAMLTTFRRYSYFLVVYTFLSSLQNEYWEI